MADFYARYAGIFGGGGGGGGGSSPLTTKGDLYTYTTVDARLPVGTDGQILSSNSATATGLEWISDVHGTPYQQIPVGAINNVNLIYTLSVAPSSLAAFSLYLDGLLLLPTTDYSISGTTITMVTAPMFAQTLFAVYTVISGGGGGLISTVSDTANIDLTVSLGDLSANLLYPKQGSGSSPVLITAAGGIAFSGNQFFSKAYIAGNGGAVNITANPQIAAGNVDGQRLLIQGKHATNTVQLDDGTGLAMNGSLILGLNQSIEFSWDLDAALWVEICRQ